MRIVILFLSLLLVAGCITIEMPADDTPAPTPVEQTTDADEEYLYHVRDLQPETRSIPDDELIELGLLACEALDAGAAPHDLIDAVDTHQDVAMTIVAAAIVVYCPEHEDYYDNVRG